MNKLGSLNADADEPFLLSDSTAQDEAKEDRMKAASRKFGFSDEMHEVIMQIDIEQNSNDRLRVKLMNKYNTYFALWRDLCVLLAVIAGVGLFYSLVMWESTFNEPFRNPDTTNIEGQNLM